VWGADLQLNMASVSWLNMASVWYYLIENATRLTDRDMRKLVALVPLAASRCERPTCDAGGFAAGRSGRGTRNHAGHWARVMCERPFAE
jgi:hypothetical protein